MLNIRPYTNNDAEAFHDLNLAWISKYFELEDEDRILLENPDSSIIEQGGRILIAELDNKPVGTVALLPQADLHTIELAKMAVDERFHKQGIGTALMHSAIEIAKEMGAHRLWLETNTKLKTALSLYRKFGFEQLSDTELRETPYCRCNCQMVLTLK